MTMARRAPAISAAPLLGWGAGRSAAALRAERADLLARLEHSHRWRSHRHQALLVRLRIVTELLLQAEAETEPTTDPEVARRDRILMRD
ncbi:hypothetical protein [Aquabacter cavernae]|uniref:hypothetical protein n=1 Tax=Aquabacter cavernae TaxID=2496029 RepID=UPI000F8E3A0A|nr:hypothetical protein [Aquabacter cavernae]